MWQLRQALSQLWHTREQALVHQGDNTDALSLLARLLSFHLTERISCEDALEHLYLQVWHDTSDEPTSPSEVRRSLLVV